MLSPRLPVALAPLVLLALMACQQDAQIPLVAEVSNEVTAKRVPEGIQIYNGTDRRIGFFIRNPNWLGLFAACVDPGSDCLRLAPAGSVVVPLDEIAGFAPETREVVVTWWTIVADGAGGYRIAEMHDVPLRLD